ncbi:MAG: hypothetical protein II557_04425, partial [Clostridia bacterium]|nr:hypothetical protein [Clostridia bacterium]
MGVHRLHRRRRQVCREDRHYPRGLPREHQEPLRREVRQEFLHQEHHPRQHPAERHLHQVEELRFNAEESRVVFLIKFHSKSDVLSFDMVQNIFPDKNKDYVIATGEQDIVLVKEVKPGTDIKEIEKIAKSIADTLNSEFYVKVSIGI